MKSERKGRVGYGEDGGAFGGVFFLLFLDWSDGAGFVKKAVAFRLISLPQVSGPQVLPGPSGRGNMIPTDSPLVSVAFLVSNRTCNTYPVILLLGEVAFWRSKLPTTPSIGTDRKHGFLLYKLRKIVADSKAQRRHHRVECTASGGAIEP